MYFAALLRVHSIGAYLHLCRLFLELKRNRVGSLVPPTTVDGCDKNLFRDIRHRQRNVQLPAEIRCQSHILAQQFKRKGFRLEPATKHGLRHLIMKDMHPAHHAAAHAFPKRLGLDPGFHSQR